MAKDFSKKFYKSAKWLKCRKSYIALRQAVDGGMCELCRQSVGYIVHHKQTLTADNITDPDVSLNHEQLMYVCLDCHNKIDHFDDCNGNKYIFDESGNIKFL